MPAHNKADLQSLYVDEHIDTPFIDAHYHQPAYTGTVSNLQWHDNSFVMNAAANYSYESSARNATELIPQPHLHAPQHQQTQQQLQQLQPHRPSPQQIQELEKAQQYQLGKAQLDRQALLPQKQRNSQRGDASGHCWLDHYVQPNHNHQLGPCPPGTQPASPVVAQTQTNVASPLYAGQYPVAFLPPTPVVPVFEPQEQPKFHRRVGPKKKKSERVEKTTGVGLRRRRDTGVREKDYDGQVYQAPRPNVQPYYPYRSPPAFTSPFIPDEAFYYEVGHKEVQSKNSFLYQEQLYPHNFSSYAASTPYSQPYVSPGSDKVASGGDMSRQLALTPGSICDSPINLLRGDSQCTSQCTTNERRDSKGSHLSEVAETESVVSDEEVNKLCRKFECPKEAYKIIQKVIAEQLEHFYTTVRDRCNKSEDFNSDSRTPIAKALVMDCMIQQIKADHRKRE